MMRNLFPRAKSKIKSFMNLILVRQFPVIPRLLIKINKLTRSKKAAIMLAPSLDALLRLRSIETYFRNEWPNRQGCWQTPS